MFGNMMGFTSIFMVFFVIIFVMVWVIIISRIVRSIKQERKNDASPRLSTEAMIVSKRMDVRRRSVNSDMHDMHNAYTRYYVTFQMPSGDRMELSVNGQEYGMLAEGDVGVLHFQGTRYLGFQRR